ncbi:MAG: MBL fold metallo-hydrolase [Candidatus Babeliales bacterium]|jgi:ribonuclease BN (tRNA processing enzyme)
MTKIIIIGSGTCVPHPSRGSPANYIFFENKHFLVDGGSGSLHALAHAGINYAVLDGIFYTHFHIDHTGDLVPTMFALTNDPTLKRTKDFVLYGPKGLKALVDTYRNMFKEWVTPKRFNIVVRELDDHEEMAIDDGTVKAYHVQHTEHSLGYRFTTATGKIIVFSGDTGYSSEVIDLAKNADLAIFECSMTEEDYERTHFQGHLTATLAGKIAHQAEVKKLVFTHIYPDTDKVPLQQRCATMFSGDSVIAQDFKIFEV